MVRLTRPQRAAVNRGQVLESAYKLFQDKGFHGATIAEIADEAGFSKGVIYSQFGSKDDLFLALIESRVERRLGQTLERVQRAAPGAALRDLWEEARARRRSEVAWSLALLEFRTHAARSPELNRRYSELHARNLDGLSEVLRALYARSDRPARYEARDVARLIAVLDAGAVLENLVSEPGATFELSRHAVWLLLTDALREPADDGRDPL